MVSERLKEYYVSNNTTASQEITLYLYDACNGTADPVLVAGTQTAPAYAETKVDFPADGTYSIVIDGDTSNGTIARSYLTLFKSFIAYTSAGLCGTAACLQYNNDESSLTYAANAHAKATYYAAVYDTKYAADIANVLTKIKCSAYTEWQNIANQENYTGASNVAYLTQIEVAHLYKSFRTTDLLTESQADIDALYEYDKISYCIQKLGITDCGTPAPIPGTKHTATMSAAPTTLGLGNATSITITYKFTANDDVFTEIVDTNIPNVSLNKLDGFTQTEIIPNQTTSTQYFITYKYSRGGSIEQNTVSVNTTAYAPQWYGGESITAKFNSGGQASVSAIKAAITNVQPVYQASAAGSSSNTDTNNKYIWWITNAPVKFFIGAFQIPSGPWSDSCDPNSYAIISEVVPTLMEDNVTIVNLYHYRTCPLQNLAGQTLQYTLTL